MKKKPRVLRSLRRLSGKLSGGQKRDKLRQVENPHRVFEHFAPACGHCRASLDARSVVRLGKPKVFDLPERIIEVSEHRASVHDCAHCRSRTRAAFPAVVVSPTQYGDRLRTAAVYRYIQQLTPEERVAEIPKDLFGAASACGASVAARVQAKAEALEPVHRSIGEWGARANVGCLDETGCASMARRAGCAPPRRSPIRSIAPANPVRPCPWICEENAAVTNHFCGPNFSKRNCRINFGNVELLLAYCTVCF